MANEFYILLKST